MKIGILSDTHGLLRPEVLAQLRGCERIYHAGDINRRDILDQLIKIAPVKVVRGNNDKDWASELPYVLRDDCGGIKVVMCHKKNEIPKDLNGVDLVLYGHTHRYEDKMADGIRWLNPGSCGPRRFHQEITMAILTIEKDRTFEVQKISVEHPENLIVEIPKEEDRAHVVSAVIAGIERRQSSEQIAKKNKVSIAFVEEISRMYLTHPGIDLDGILNRLK